MIPGICEKLKLIPAIRLANLKQKELKNNTQITSMFSLQILKFNDSKKKTDILSFVEIKEYQGFYNV